DIIAKYQEMVSAAAVESDPAVREQMYFDMQQAFYDDAVSVILAQSTGFRFGQRYLQGWHYRVGQFSTFRSTLSQNYHWLIERCSGGASSEVPPEHPLSPAPQCFLTVKLPGKER